MNLCLLCDKLISSAAALHHYVKCAKSFCDEHGIDFCSVVGNIKCTCGSHGPVASIVAAPPGAPASPIEIPDTTPQVATDSFTLFDPNKPEAYFTAGWDQSIGWVCLVPDCLEHKASSAIS